MDLGWHLEVILDRVVDELVAVDADVAELRQGFPEGAGFLGAAGGVVLGVEVEDGLLPAEIAGREPLPTLGYELDAGQLLALPPRAVLVIQWGESR